MPVIETMNMETQKRGELNDAQRRRLGVTCSYIDKFLCEVEQVLREIASKSSFPQHVVDVTIEVEGRDQC